VFNQGIPFGMYGMGQTANWPMYTANPHLLHGYQQDPYAMLGRSWPSAQIPNPWAMQALLTELIGTIARQGHMGHMGFGGLPYSVPSYPTLVGQFGPQGSYGAGLPGLPGLAGRYQSGFPGVTNFPGVTSWWDGGVGAGIGNGALGGANFGGIPFPTGVSNWAVPSMAMV
jgi:hypothetical protein